MSTSRMSRLRGRAAAVTALAGATVLLAAVPAFAHVTVQPNTATKGSYSTIAFKVPNERDGASTIKIEVNLPTDHPIASVSLQPVPGWTGQVTTSKLATPIKTDDGTVDQAVTKITWSGGKIAPGQFQQFPVSFGPLPSDAAALSFKTLQTYSNGEVVRWIEIPQAGQAEPQNPAPTLTLTAPADEGAATATATGTPAPAPASDSKGTTQASSGGSDSDGTARALGVVGIVIGAAGVGFGVFAGRRRTASQDGPGGGSAA
ncbi:YcnI family copper-binding membrane protein [Streptomyces sp. NBC_01198]|uniref:YcnI family copper-binding membrane protein n=1 Tax=Streptomyces sp. NBC_01198 TaxID=2903769 RepID=UPI002E145611|nr:YcnI family protein [Streptomyces sp. NBC_01198]